MAITVPAVGGHFDGHLYPTDDPNHDSMVQALYDNFPRTADEFIIKGYQCSHHVQNPILMKEIAEYFPETKLIVTVSHPLKWFETHLAQQDGSRGLRGTAPSSSRRRPPAFMLTGGFHQYLAIVLGKTMLGPDERAPFDSYAAHQLLENKHIVNASNCIFFADVSQLDDSNQTRAFAFRQDLQNFLGLKEEELPLMPLACQEPALSNSKLDICSKANAAPIRTELMHISRNASSWFRKYFLKSPAVVVSSRDYLESLFESWMIDPCEEAANTLSSINIVALLKTQSGPEMPPVLFNLETYSSLWLSGLSII